MTGNTSLHLADFHRAQYVERWHILRTSRRQSVAEHSYMVAMIADELAEAMGLDDPIIRMQILQWALLHDLSEVVLGDVVTFTKRAAKEAFDAMEEKIDPVGAAYKRGLPDIVLGVVKLADYIDAIKYLSEERQTLQISKVKDSLYVGFNRMILGCQNKYGYQWGFKMASIILDELLDGSQTFIDDVLNS